jgi:putative membrane protein insertion efficiency factor
MELMKKFMLAAIKGYRRWISPAFYASCRFEPSCSAYAMTALECHGTLKGSLLAAKRLLKCHPFHPGGYDPVPEKKDSMKFQISNSKFDRSVIPESGIWNLKSHTEE